MSTGKSQQDKKDAGSHTLQEALFHSKVEKIYYKIEKNKSIIEKNKSEIEKKKNLKSKKKKKI